MAYKTGLQLLNGAQTLTEDDTISSENALIWINEFLTDKLGSNAMIKSTQLYADSEAQKSYDLPADFIESHKVEEYSNSAMDSTVDRLDRGFLDYEIDDTHIIFNYSGHYKLHYFILPTELTSINDDVEIDPEFYQACKLWIAYRHLTFDDEDNAAANTLGNLRMQEFYTALKSSINKRKKRLFKKKHKIRRVC